MKTEWWPGLTWLSSVWLDLAWLDLDLGLAWPVFILNKQLDVVNAI
jgi:hypothetical protein